MSGIKPPTLAADPNALSGVRRQAQSQDLAALKETTKQFESLLTKMMLKSMRDANKSFGDSLFGSSQQDMYQDMFDDQLTSQLAGGRGLGLADLLFQQLSRSTAGSKGASSPADALIANPAPTRAPRIAATQAASTRAATTQAQAATQPSTAKEDFVRSLLPLAREAGAQLGVDPHALVAQAALETGWGKSVPANASGDSSFNLFGIKAGARWSGATVSVPTREFESGTAVRRVESFRSYESAADSFRDYAGLIRNNPRYADAVGTGKDVAAFASALQQGGYATDPQYAVKVTAVANEVRALAGGPFKSGEPMPLYSFERKTS